MNLPLDALKIAVLGIGGWAVAAALRRAPASTRHDVWLLAVFGALLVPATELVLPPLYVTVPSTWQPLEQPAGRWLPLAIGIWAAGVLVCTVRVVTGLLELRSLVRRNTPWSSAAAARALGEAARDAGVRRPVTLIRSDDVQVPATWGVRRPFVLLPSAAAGWTPQRLGLVLVHELVHIRRQDAVIEALVWVARTLYWFHPAVWLATGRLRLEREHTCDEAVLATGARPSDYCEHLLDIMSAATGHPRGVTVGTAMATRCTVERRVRAMLAATPRPQAGPPRRWSGASLIFGGAVAIYALSALVPCSWTADQQAAAVVVRR